MLHTELSKLVLESKKLIQEKNAHFLTLPKHKTKPAPPRVSLTKSAPVPGVSEEKKMVPQEPIPRQEILLPKEDAHATMKQLIKGCAPHMTFRDPLPPIVILTCEPEKEFLENLAKAISQHIAPATVIESDKERWKNFLNCSTLKCILGPPALVGKDDSPVHESFFLKPSILFFPLAHTLQYQKNQSLKRDLWMRLKTLSL